jgi:hypothetical protein
MITFPAKKPGNIRKLFFMSNAIIRLFFKFVTTVGQFCKKPVTVTNISVKGRHGTLPVPVGNARAVPRFSR